MIDVQWKKQKKEPHFETPYFIFVESIRIYSESCENCAAYASVPTPSGSEASSSRHF